MNHLAPKAPITERTHRASRSHSESVGRGHSPAVNGELRSLTSSTECPPAAETLPGQSPEISVPLDNSPDWQLCGLGASFGLENQETHSTNKPELTNREGSTTPPRKANRSSQSTRTGLTLLELVIVLMITVALAGVMVPLVSDHVSDAAETATKATLSEIRNAVTLFWQDDDRSPKQVPKIHDLFVDPFTNTTAFRFDPTYKLGWRGPYLREATGSYEVGVPHSSFAATYGNTGDRALLDAWGRTVVIQSLDPVNGVRDVRVVSAGPDGQIKLSDDPMNPDTNAELLADPTLAGDDVYVAFTLR